MNQCLLAAATIVYRYRHRAQALSAAGGFPVPPCRAAGVGVEPCQNVEPQPLLPYLVGGTSRQGLPHIRKRHYT